jgi:carnitine O-acetyltransferase
MGYLCNADWFDVLDDDNLPLLTEREVLLNLQAIVKDANSLLPHEVAREAVGLLSTENRKVWASLRSTLSEDRTNAACLRVVDTALFVVCLDDASPADLAQTCANYLCGTYELSGGVQVGTCTNRWYDKLQIIVTADGAAGINFEHTGVDGHTVLRYVRLHIYRARPLSAGNAQLCGGYLHRGSHAPRALDQPIRADALPRHPLATRQIIQDQEGRTTGATYRELRHDAEEARLAPDARAARRNPLRRDEAERPDLPERLCRPRVPRVWQGVHYEVLPPCYSQSYLSNPTDRHGFSPDAFVQIAFQAAYFGLYGRIECTYEPAMTKNFLHGRTEAIRTVQPESVEFVKVCPALMRSLGPR